MTLFHEVLGHRLATTEGIRSAYTPADLGKEAASNIVRAANKFRQASKDAPYALVVSADGPKGFEPDVPVISLKQTVKYRSGNRLFIFLGGSKGLASIEKSVEVLLSDSYPDNAKSPVDTESIARAVVSAILHENSIAAEEDTLSGPAEYVLSAMNILVELHKSASSSSSADWNLSWIRHVSEGIENLRSLMASAKLADSNMEIGQFFSKFTFGSFGLPLPSNGVSYKGITKSLSSDFEIAVGKNWKDENQVALSLNQLRMKHPETQNHPASLLPWDSFDRAMSAKDNYLLAFLELATADTKHILHFSDFPEEDFFNPFPKNTGGELEISSLDTGDARKLPLVGSVNKLQFVRAVEHSETPSKNFIMISETVSVRVPTLQALTAQEASSTKAKIRVSGRAKLSFDGSAQLNEGSLVYVGKFTLDAGKTPFKMLSKTFNLEIVSPPSDGLTGKIDDRATASLIFIPDLSSGLLVAELKSGNKLSKVKYMGPDTYESEQDSFRHEISGVGKPHFLLGWGESLALEGSQQSPVEGFSDLYSCIVPIASTIELSLAHAGYFLETPNNDHFIESPIHAAAKKALLTGEDPSFENANSLFGKLDTAFSRILSSESWEKTLMHSVLPTEGNFVFEELGDYSFEKPVLTTQEVYNEWDLSTHFPIHKNFQQSEIVTEFREAFKGLRVKDALIARGQLKGRADWSSRTSWAFLWDDGATALQRYLDAYSEMVDAARGLDDPYTLFWASYPFSASVWDTRESGKCLAVILSPLHPLRLGWLSGAEWVLRNSDDSEQLAGAIEGWNLPSLGTGPTLNGSTIAIPTDSGIGQVFLGWSMMAVASIAGFEPPRIPIKIAGLEAPGGGGSGLNKSSTTAALTDYRRVNPHVTTMTIDLAASSQTPRLKELDEAILSSISIWSSEQEQEAPGGVRVWDSSNRIGVAPVTQASKVASGLSGVPMTWTRYKHVNAETKRCNVRFLQDSGIRVEVSKGHAAAKHGNTGLIGKIPLRRFEASNGQAQEQMHSQNFPGLNGHLEWGPYGRALQALEQTKDRAPSIRSQIFKALLVDDNAEWTVSGESLMSPSGVAGLLSAEKKSQMLWEWRPPIFGPGTDFALERRPFISVARVPISFKGQIGELLAKAQGVADGSDRVDDVLGRLGSRGVGLSSLLSIGGTQASGALGFYLSLSLLDQLESFGQDTFVMPIDACDSYLRILSGKDLPTDLTQRADLLCISLTDSTITLTPVEIKFYGLSGNTSDQSRLPGPNDKALDKAKEQAFETKALLNVVASRYRDIIDGSNSATKALWLNALTTLTEAAIRLSPSNQENPERLAMRLNALLNGELTISTGRPLITYYLHNGMTASGNKLCLEQVKDEEGEWGLLSVNTSEAFQMLNPSEISREWLDLANWCVLEPAVPERPRGALPEEPQEPALPEEPQEPALPEEPQEPALPEEPQEPALPEEPQEPALPEEPQEPALPEEPKEPAAPTWQTLYPKEDGVRITVGNSVNTISPSPVDFWPGNTKLSQMNMGVVGNLGTGKTQFLKSLVTQIRVSAQRAQPTPVSFLIFDYKRDYQNEDFINRVGGRILSPENRIPLNVLSLNGGYSQLKAKRRALAFCDVLNKIYGGVGPVQKDLLTKTIVKLFETNPENRAPSLSQVEASYTQEKGGPDAVSAILNKFVLLEVFEEDPEKIESFQDLLKDKVVVVALNQFGADSETKNALVVLMLDLYYEYMGTAEKHPVTGTEGNIRRLNSFLLVDEATNIMQYDFSVLQSILTEGREWGFGTILASQYLSHFKTPKYNYGEPLKTWVIHNVPFVKQQELLQLGLSDATEATVKLVSKLQIHEALYDSFGHDAIKIEGLAYFRL